MQEEGSQTSLPMKPQVVAWELGKRLRDDAIVVADSGTNTTWWARHIPARRGQSLQVELRIRRNARHDHASPIPPRHQSLEHLIRRHPNFRRH